MNLRRLTLNISRFLQYLRVPDHTLTPPAGRFVLYSCHDVDRSMKEGSKAYSPILRGLREIYDELGFAAVNLTHPYTICPPESVLGGSYTVNYRTLWDRLTLIPLRLAAPERAERIRLDRETRFYKMLLRRLRPSLIMSIQPPLGMCAAARQLGITVIEPMHGTNFSTTNTIFTKHFSIDERYLPRIVLAFDDVTQNTLLSLTTRRDVRPFRTRDPWLQYNRLAKVRFGTYNQSSGRKTVLVTLQWGYDGEREALSNIIPNGIMHPALEGVFEAAPEVDFRIRMHPIQVNKPGYAHHRRYIEDLAARTPNVEVTEATSLPLPILLDASDGHITMSSGAVGNAADVGVPSLAICPTLREGGTQYGYFRELHTAGLVTYGTLRRDDILDWVRNLPIRDKSSSFDVEAAHLEDLEFHAALAAENATEPAT